MSCPEEHTCSFMYICDATVVLSSAWCGLCSFVCQYVNFQQKILAFFANPDIFLLYILTPQKYVVCRSSNDQKWSIVWRTILLLFLNLCFSCDQICPWILLSTCSFAVDSVFRQAIQKKEKIQRITHT